MAGLSSRRLWSLGTIPFYAVAFSAAALLGLAAAIWALANETRPARWARAVRGQDRTEGPHPPHT